MPKSAPTPSSQLFDALLNQDQALWIEQPNTLIGSPADRAARERSAVAFLANLNSLGFGLNKASWEALTELSVEAQGQLYQSSWPKLLESVGAHRTFEPMYPQFPKQVAEASELELFINAIMHYTGDLLGVRIVPNYPIKVRKPLKEALGKMRPLRLVSTAQALERWSSWCTASVAWSETQRAGVVAGLQYIVAQQPTQLAEWLPLGKMQNRENKAVLTAELLRARHTATSDLVAVGATARQQALNALPVESMITSVTDVLRCAVAWSGGDVSLAEPPKFAPFPRAIRRALLSALDQAIPKTATAEEDVWNRREGWLRLGERLHPGEMEKAYPDAAALFDQLRNDKAPTSVMGHLDAALSTAPTPSAIKTITNLFVQRPGVLARNLHRVLRWTDNAKSATSIVDAFEANAEKCGTNMLLTIAHLFATQHDRERRVVLPKGKLGKIMTTDTVPAAIDAAWANRVVAIAENTLRARFAALPALGASYVDPDLDAIPLPFAMRSASKALHTLPRGSRLPVSDTKGDITRLFLWWSETDPAGVLPRSERIDIDLSCLVLDANGHTIDECTFYNLRNRTGKEGALTHSGDITSAPHGACEFIDINRDKLAAHARYVVMVINSYTSQPYAEVPECFAGWMNRKHGQRGEVFEPRTVKQRFDVTSDSTSVIPMAIDVTTNEIIWIDMPFKAGRSRHVGHQTSATGAIIEGITSLSRPSMGLLFRLHAEARGSLVQKIKDADHAFTVLPQDDRPGVTAFDALEIASTWLPEPDRSLPAPPTDVKSVSVVYKKSKR